MNESFLKSNESLAFSDRIGEIIHSNQPDGRVFERYRRAPGTRLVVVDTDGRILITKEHRHEAGGIDLRLPGGKVCGTLTEYHDLLASGQDIVEAAKVAATQEALEETGLIVHDLRLITKSAAGATVEWDLYYFHVGSYEVSPDGQQLGHGEDIEVTWVTPDELKQAIVDGQMQEWRSVGVLLGLVLPGLG